MLRWSFPVSVSSNSRFLRQADGSPFPFFLDSSWSLAMNLSPSDQQVYLTDRKKKLFNVILVQAMEHDFSLNKAPLDFAGNLPFTTRLDGGSYTGTPNGTTGSNGNENQFAADPYSNINNEAPNYTFPNATFWARMSTFLDLTLANGFLVKFWPSYVGFAGGQEGWMGEMVANDAVTGAGGQTGQPYADPSKTLMWNYGAYVANFLNGRTNIVIVHGGDYGSAGGLGGAFTTSQKAAVNNLMAGMLSNGGSQWPHTGHWSRPSNATDVTLSAGSFDLESAYVNAPATVQTRIGYANSPTKPVFTIENVYDESTSTAGPYRRFPWWGFTNGGTVCYGNDHSPWGLWRFPSTWQTLLNTQCAFDVARLNAFVQSLNWSELVPSGLGGQRTIITRNANTPTDQTYVSSSASLSGELCVAYVPPAWTDGSLDVDMGVMSGLTLARWFDPTNATYRNIGTFAAGGTRTFTPPGANSAGDTDWALVMTRPDKSNFNFGGF